MNEMVHVMGTPSIKDGVCRLRQRCVTPIGVLCFMEPYYHFSKFVEANIVIT